MSICTHMATHMNRYTVQYTQLVLRKEPKLKMIQVPKDASSQC